MFNPTSQLFALDNAPVDIEVQPLRSASLLT